MQHASKIGAIVDHHGRRPLGHGGERSLVSRRAARGEMDIDARLLLQRGRHLGVHGERVTRHEVDVRAAADERAHQRGRLRRAVETHADPRTRELASRLQAIGDAPQHRHAALGPGDGVATGGDAVSSRRHDDQPAADSREAAAPVSTAAARTNVCTSKSGSLSRCIPRRWRAP